LIETAFRMMPTPADSKRMLPAHSIDSHQHFWNYSAVEYPWIPSGSPLHRDWLPADLAALQQPYGMAGAIAVQARQTVQETEWLLGMSERAPCIQGVVGWVPLVDERVDSVLEQFVSHPKFVGVRHVVQDEQDPVFMLRPEFMRGIRKLERFGLVYDILIYAHQLPAAFDLVRLFPNQVFVLDHLGKPAIASKQFEPWATRMKQLAQCENVFCKVSGLVTEANHESWTVDDLRPYLDLAFLYFTPSRLLFGSDWPVCLLASDYDRWISLLLEYTAYLGEPERAAFFGGNARSVYLSRNRNQ
jgi:L-fuconolactonase